MLNRKEVPQLTPFEALTLAESRLSAATQHLVSAEASGWRVRIVHAQREYANARREYETALNRATLYWAGHCSWAPQLVTA
jgi:hypothetical protein